MTARTISIETLDDYESLVGQEFAVSEWIDITQDRINRFAEATGDHQWIHVDVERARQSELGHTIAHGYLVLSLIAGLSDSTIRLKNLKMGINYGLNRVRFTDRVPAGSRLRARFRLLRIQRIDGGLQVQNEVTMEREGSDKPVCVAETIALLFA